METMKNLESTFDNTRNTINSEVNKLDWVF